MHKTKCTFGLFSVIYPLLHVASDRQDMINIGDLPSSDATGATIERLIQGMNSLAYLLLSLKLDIKQLDINILNKSN